MSDWLNRTLLVGPNLALVTSSADMDKLTKQVGVFPPEVWLPDHWDACTHTWRVDSQLICMVCLNLDRARDMGPTAVAALLVHEATHVWQETKEKIGSEICNETEAYAMQNICRELFDAYARKIVKKSRLRNEA